MSYSDWRCSDNIALTIDREDRPLSCSWCFTDSDGSERRIALCYTYCHYRKSSEFSYVRVCVCVFWSTHPFHAASYRQQRRLTLAASRGAPTQSLEASAYSYKIHYNHSKVLPLIILCPYKLAFTMEIQIT